MKRALFRETSSRLFSTFSKFLTPFVLIFLKPTLAFADTTVDVKPKGDFGKLFDFSQSGFGDVVGRAITVLFVIAVVIALGFLVYGGIKWIISGGDKAAVESARNTIVASVVGLVIVFLSYFILNIILGFFGLTFSSLVLPRLTP